MTSKIGVAVAGLGSMGRQHVRVLSEMPDVELVGAADVSHKAREQVEANTGVVTSSDWRSLLDGPAQAVINALPTPEHYEVTRGFLEAGKDVLVEKPIAVTSEEAEELVALARKLDRVLLVGHVERFNPAVRALRAVLDSGEIGEVVTIAARRVGIARPVAPKSDVVIDLAIHDIDVCAYLLPQTQGRLAFASARALWGNKFEDHADLVLRFGDAIAMVQANWITPVKIRRITVTGTTGLADVDYLEQSLRIYRGVPEVFEGPLWNFFAVARESEPEEMPVAREEPLRNELNHFVERVRTRETSVDEARQAAQALALAVEARSLIRGMRHA
jgi:UDP-N-acetylglucosamine 3-dehydrogenase